MDDDHDKAVRSQVREINAWAEVHTMADTADQTAALVRELLEMPTITGAAPSANELMLLLLLRRKAEAAKRLLALVASTA